MTIGKDVTIKWKGYVVVYLVLGRYNYDSYLENGKILTEDLLGFTDKIVVQMGEKNLMKNSVKVSSNCMTMPLSIGHSNQYYTADPG